MESNSYKEILKTNESIYSGYAKEYDERTKNGYTNYLQAFIDEFISKIRGNVVYDLGCGPGRDLQYFVSKGLLATGVDCSDGMLDICRKKGLKVVKNDFLNIQYEPNSVDAIWAYTSHTVIPKETFLKLLAKYRLALKEDTGILGLGMIEGDFEGWKSDHKYEGAKRFVARYTSKELEVILKRYFGSVWVKRENVGGKIYLHCLCKNTGVALKQDTAKAAKQIFDKFSDQYLANTQSGIALLEKDRAALTALVTKAFGTKAKLIDIGCGPGRDLVVFKNQGIQVMGLDISDSNVDNCRKNGVDAIQGNIYELEKYFSEDQFDAVWCNCSVTNWIIKEELRTVLKKIKAITKNKGYIFMGSVLGNFSGWEIDNKYDKMKRYNNHWMEDELRESLSILGSCIYENKLEKTGKKDYLNLIYVNEK